MKIVNIHQIARLKVFKRTNKVMTINLTLRDKG